MQVVDNNFVEVFIWRARDTDNFVTTASEGARFEQKANRGHARVGHAAMLVNQNKVQTYMSLWPNRRGVENQRAILVKNLEEEKTSYEGADPDVIVRLYNLNIEKIIVAFKKIEKRVKENCFAWDWNATDNDDATHPKCDKASCVSFVWSLLKAGNIQNWKQTGPTDSEFYKILKCNLAQVFWGYFDTYSWTNKFFSPYALSLRVGSAAEAHEKSKEVTIEIMRSNRVTETKERPSNWGFSLSVVATALAMAAIYTVRK